jgi:hypothetical protein
VCGRAGQVMPLAQEDLGDKVQLELKLSPFGTVTCSLHGQTSSARTNFSIA